MNKKINTRIITLIVLTIVVLIVVIAIKNNYEISAMQDVQNYGKVEILEYEENEIQTGWQQIGENWYYFNDKGIMQTGWLKYNAYWYYLAPYATDTYYKGAMVTGWQQLEYNGEVNWYYFAKKNEIEGLPEGAMVIGWQNIDGTNYYFNGSGEYQSGISSELEKIHFIKVGGDSILVESNGHYGLIDASNPSGNDGYEKLRIGEGDKSNKGSALWDTSSNGETVAKYLKSIGVINLDFVLATHNHSDHIGGIPDICNATNALGTSFINSNTVYIYKQYQEECKNVEKADYEKAWYNGEFCNRAIEAMQNKGAKLLEVENGHSISNLKAKLGYMDSNPKFLDNSEDTCDYIEFNFQTYNLKIFNLYTLAVDNENTNSLVTLITTKENKKILLMGDMNVINNTEQIIGKYIGNVELLKANHHGAFNSNSLGLLKATDPKVVIIPTLAGSVSAFFSVPMFYLQGTHTPIYKVGDGNLADVAVINSSINIYTYDSSSKKLGANAPTISDGIQKGWIRGNGDTSTTIWMYIDNSGQAITGWRYVPCLNASETRNGWFYFDDAGIMQTGWLTYENNQYYLTTMTTEEYYCGEMVTGWQLINEKWYYFAIDNTEVSGYPAGAKIKGPITERLAVELKEHQEKEEGQTKYIVEIKPGTTIEELEKNILTNGNIELYDGQTKVQDKTAKIKTGMTVKIVLNEQEVEYTAVVTGDITGNGNIGGGDILKLARYIAGLDTDLTGAYLEATDVYRDGKYAQSSDLLKMARVMAGLDEL